MTPTWLTWKQAKAEKKIPFSKYTAKRKARAGQFPPFHKFGGPTSPDFLHEQVLDGYLRDPEAWIAENAKQPTH